MKKLLFLLCFLQFGCSHYSTLDYVKFGAGALTAGIIHEGAHKIVSEIQDNPIHFNGLSFTAEHEQSRVLKMAGLTANAITNEIIINARPKLKERDPFLTGLLWAGIAEEFIYPVFRYGNGDFSGNGKAIGFRVGFTFHSLSVIWREWFGGWSLK